MKTKAQILAEWVIGITVAYPVLILITYFLFDNIKESVTSILVGFCLYSAMPLLIINWVLSIWSLKLKKKMVGFWALFFTIISTFLFVFGFYLMNTVKMC
ncbi:hypothetical protein DRF65_19915 [Chryseobacterium pennae]|uniref:Uncharacterized protein n=1 Tax=Chryseobacterium pennae TaxID=2258962 RepID=A0A3D9C4P0_9FLAO|nr:hypothetical protein DRF65_19915 [Chryseobacterium pennae]